MNAPIYRLFAALLVLLTLLVAFTSRWAVFDSDDLRARSENRRPLIADQQIPRGDITTVDGVLVAESVAQGRGAKRIYQRRYPDETAQLFGHPVGFDFIDSGRTGIELSENDVLAGAKSEFATLIEQLQGNAREGSNLTLTLDSGAQRRAAQMLGGRTGSVVAIEPSTGAVRVMVSTPGYDPNQVPDGVEPGFNRTTQLRYPPGSTMKVVTAVAALDSGEFDTDTVLNADSPQDFSGQPLANSGGLSLGDIPLSEALTNSVNTYFAQVGEQIGAERLLEYMRRFGFESDPELDYPDGQMVASGVINSRNKLVDSGFDIARVAIGQGGEEGQLLATPIQMAEVAAAVANDGTLMRPTFVQEVTDADGRTTDELGDGDRQSDVMSSDTAAKMTELMGRVTEDGTASGLSMSVPFAGKTGTAEIGNVADGVNQPWFIGFAPREDPRVAIAVTVDPCAGCFGGEVAGPIATAVMEDLLR